MSNVERLKEFEPESPSRNTSRERDDEVVARLAAAPLLEYDRVREAEAKRLGVRVSTLDRLVACERGEEDESDEVAVMFPVVEPWPEPVDGTVLLDDVAAVFERHMVLPPCAADAVALWVTHSHTIDTAAISPILAITSPSPECGKTTFLTLLGSLVPRALHASNITAPTVFRAVEKWQPTLLIDEADTFLRNSDDLRGILNSGHNRAAAYVLRTQGDEHEPRRFRTWSPKGIALIGKLPPTLASRSLHIELRRKGAGELRDPVRGDRLQHLAPLQRRLVRFAGDHELKLRVADPDLPVNLSGRRADNWRHLIAIADAVGGEWPKRARQAAETLSANDLGETAGIMLLSDVRDIFEERVDGKIASADLAEELGKLETRPWPEWKGKTITTRQVAKLLEPFGVSPSTIRTGGTTAKGYRIEQFEDAFARYLPDCSSQRHNPQGTVKNYSLGSVTPPSNVTVAKTPKPIASATCDGVTDEYRNSTELEDIEREGIQMFDGIAI
jgi:putative DNA primase/helicase